MSKYKIIIYKNDGSKEIIELEDNEGLEHIKKGFDLICYQRSIDMSKCPKMVILLEDNKTIDACTYDQEFKNRCKKYEK